MTEQEKVRVDWFMADVVNLEIDLTEKLVGALMANAVEYLHVNGGMPWEKWSLLSGASRIAFVEAAKQLKLRDTIDIPQ